MTTNFNIDKTKNLFNGFGTSFCDTIYSTTLSATTDTTIAVPLTAALGAPTATSKNKFLAIISCTPTDAVYMALNATAAVPAGNTFAATTSELIPNGYTAKTVKSGDTIHFYSASTASITVAFYAIQE